MSAAPAAPTPRVLLLSLAAFNRVNGTGITLSNLFRGWPRDHLAMIHGELTPPSEEICETYFEVGGREIRRLGPLLGMRPIRAETGAAPSAKQTMRRRIAVAARRVAFGNMLPDSGR
ncbi:MAG TPA: hypothetical protein VHV78_07760, partial [Gemmatimonadaceae bacterium]|nr:hypothetical protein [Gemmatimonadaceae bacterium]